ncbi:stalk domain-containing protein [Paenibacillus koleovorans]|uniref:stalk domain-containing protein n=1 Tax=Paenibacillus koleovorans TaxID=121608 RepID=UPI000FD87710|nr:stalk domain-containing protein [Paenibacillus koleovorans]
MKKFIIGLTCGLAIATTTAVYASESSVRKIFINGNLFNSNVQVTEDGTTWISARALAESLGAKVSWHEQTNSVEILNQYPYFLASLLNGKYSFEYEIITGDSTNIDSQVVYSEGYNTLPDNSIFQKLFLLLLIDQLDLDTKSTKRIEFWKNKEDAIAYVTKNYNNNSSTEGWTGMNSRFGDLVTDGDRVLLSHYLSAHDREIISFGKYKDL